MLACEAQRSLSLEGLTVLGVFSNKAAQRETQTPSHWCGHLAAYTRAGGVSERGAM